MTHRRDFPIGARVELHPATDDWMRGDRYGVVAGYGRKRDYIDHFTKQHEMRHPILVVLDKSGRKKRFHPDNLTVIETPRTNPRQDPRAAQLVFGDVAEWAVAANIAPGDRIAFLGYAGRGREGPEYKERTGTVHLVGPAGPVVSLPGDRFGSSPVVVTQDKFLRVISRKQNPPEAEQGTIADFIRRHHVTSTAVEDPSIPDDPEWRGATHWKVRLKVGSRSMTIPFHMGSAHTRPPATDDALNALGLDSSSYENARGDFAEWASEYGLDPDSRKAEGTWRQVGRQAKALKQLLGAAAYEELLYHTESL